MPIKLIDDLSERIVYEIARHTDGVSVDLLHGVLAEVASRRTLQRRLGDLLTAGTIVATGRGRGTRYRRAVAYAPAPAEPLVVAEPIPAPEYVPLFTGSHDIVEYVRRPLYLRTPVGYEQSFLDAYVPNDTYYLSADLREHFHRIGRTGEELHPAGTTARRLIDRLLIDLSWASSRLEGNSYSRLETQRLIEFGQLAEGKDVREAQMILNHKRAIEFLVADATAMTLNKQTIRTLHALLSRDLLTDNRDCGRVRSEIVEISGSVFYPLGVPLAIDPLLELILLKADRITDPFEQSFFLMVHVPYLQPFIDVNKRVSRLAANIPLIRHNLCPLSFIYVPERAYIEATIGVYELRRTELLRDVFIWAYERSCQSYVAVRNRPEVYPDPLGMLHQATLTEIVGEIIRNNMPADEPTIRRVAASHAEKPSDVEDLNRLTHRAFASMHDGNCAMYKVKPREYLRWKECWNG
ncbi:MAG: Fic family protein [Candidatus Kapabacteria bacterium]|nr:Fic family protein [Candidatus Kapabacteria bacterium]